MDNLPAILALMIPIVAVAGWYASGMVGKWHDVEEKRLALQASQGTLGAPELERRVMRVEEDLSLMRMELTDTMKDIDERLARIELLLREVE
jgi:hypothetical protein